MGFCARPNASSILAKAYLIWRLAAKGDVRDEERAQIEREIARTDREIDALVYDVYGLTREERRLVEAAG